uniref:Uncharacterized protein n=1 Tax=Chlamydomonas leiostraca TaxID=1034604 RepID=A0A7S0RR68_9CHLO|mmetsp:Transcript_29022/g.74056  ORF Transcript_29022/g.74056 Transcript_29022/m.74056 type:complete len:105 (+) Transcript_29022:284-598(+)
MDQSARGAVAGMWPDLTYLRIDQDCAIFKQDSEESSWNHAQTQARHTRGYRCAQHLPASGFQLGLLLASHCCVPSQVPASLQLLLAGGVLQEGGAGWVAGHDSG